MTKTKMSVAAINSRFQKLESIGSGAFGNVYRARDRRSGEIVAMKCLRARHDTRAFASEVAALEAFLGHPSIVQLRAATATEGAGAGGGDDEAVLVMEFVGPSLRHVMRDVRRGRWHTELEVRVLMRQLLAGAAGMHRLGLMHRDLKPENILMDARGRLKICDLGLSCPTAAAGSPGAGTRWYSAPEVLLRSPDYDERVDSWSLGCIMAELLAGKHPFHRGGSDMEQLSEVLGVLGVDDIKGWRGYDASRFRWGCGPWSFLRSFFPSPEEARLTGRPALSEAGFEVLSGLLRCNPDERMTAAAALRHRWFREVDTSGMRRKTMATWRVVGTRKVAT